jgi:surface antigen
VALRRVAEKRMASIGNAGPRAGAVLALALALMPGSGWSADDPRDEAFLSPVLQRALETARTGVEVPWRNPATGNGGAIVVERTFYREPETPCRAYARTLTVPGAPAEVTKGTGCRTDTGLWLVEEEPVVAAPALGTTPPTAPPSGPGRAPTTVAEGPTCPDTVLVPMPSARPPVFAYGLPAKAEL